MRRNCRAAHGRRGPDPQGGEAQGGQWHTFDQTAKGDLIRKRKENHWAWERGRAEDNGGEGRRTAKYNGAYVRSCPAETHSYLG